jgi:hypothetical protein
MELLDLVVNKEYDIINIAKGETSGPGNVMKLTLTELKLTGHDLNLNQLNFLDLFNAISYLLINSYLHYQMRK